MGYPSFSAGDTLAASDMNAVGLWLVKKQTISTASTVQTITDAFNASFTSYRIVATGLVAASISGLNLRMGTTAAGYYSSAIYADTTTVNATGANNGSEWPVSVLTTSANASIVFDVHHPYEAAITSFQGMGSDNRTTGYPLRIAGGWLNNTTSYTSFSLYAGANITGGTVRVYGYRN